MIDARALLAAVRDVLRAEPALAGELRAALGATDDDALISLDAAGAIVGKTARAIRDAGRRGDLAIVNVGRSPRVRRSALLAWARPVSARPANTAAADPRADARASIDAAAARIGRTA